MIKTVTSKQASKSMHTHLLTSRSGDTCRERYSEPSPRNLPPISPVPFGKTPAGSSYFRDDPSTDDRGTDERACENGHTLLPRTRHNHANYTQYIGTELYVPIDASPLVQLIQGTFHKHPRRFHASIYLCSTNASKEDVYMLTRFTECIPLRKNYSDLV